MDELHPNNLNYMSSRDERTPWNWVRFLRLAAAASIPPVVCYACAWLGIQWMMRQPGWHSGQPWEGIYQPKFIGLPWNVCTLLVSAEAVFVVAMVASHRWKPSWLLTLLFICAVWMFFNAAMFTLDDNVFP